MAFNLTPMADAIPPPPPRPAWFRSLAGSLLTLRAGDVLLYRLADEFSGALILLMVVFGPWMFGTTQTWAIWTMTLAGAALGLLLVLKLFIRRGRGYPAPRWEHFSARSGTHFRRIPPFTRRLTCWLGWLTVGILVWCLVSAWNAAATYDPVTRLFTYGPHWNWLPHSLDGHRSWFYFWVYLGLAGSFWSIWDWLCGLTSTEERAARIPARAGTDPVPRLSQRLRRLLWLLCLNGAALGVEAIVQRASGTEKLLFLIPTQLYPQGDFHFGPYAYRSNAAQYFNLVWPVCLGFWWTLHRAAGSRDRAHHWLLPCAAVMAACPVISTTRAGALVAAGMALIAVVYLTVVSLRSPAGSRPWLMPVLLGMFLAVAAGLGWYFGWNLLAPRLDQLSAGYANREEMFDAARPMAADYPVFGTGPGTFATVFQLYRFSNATYWPEQLHNDWLETRITFGGLGFGLIFAAFACVGLRRFASGGIRGGRRLGVLVWLALTGCLVHAGVDFPLQIHSVLFLFLLLCAVLFSLSGRGLGKS